MPAMEDMVVPLSQSSYSVQRSEPRHFLTIHFDHLEENRRRPGPDAAIGGAIDDHRDRRIGLQRGFANKLVDPAFVVLVAHRHDALKVAAGRIGNRLDAPEDEDE
jgi:hypothetical protein